jgi:hypothetical protein
VSKRIEVFFSDFSESMQQELLEAHHVSSADDMNWGSIPLAVLYVESDEDSEDDS